MSLILRTDNLWWILIVYNNYYILKGSVSDDTLPTTINVIVLFPQFSSSEKSFLFEEVASCTAELNIRSILIPRIESNNYLVCYKVSSRRANASLNQCFSFKTELIGGALGKLSIFTGTTRLGESKEDEIAKSMNGKSIIGNENWVKDIDTKGNSLFKNIIIRFMNDLKIISQESLATITKFQEERYPKRSAMKSTQFESPDDENSSPSESPLGKSVPHLSGLNCATGQALFTEDIPKLQNELFYAYVGSSRAHAKIVSIDPAQALAMPGVVRYIGIKDVPAGKNIFANPMGCPGDELIFAEDTVVYEGMPIGGIVAENEQIARKAASLVEITYEDLKPIVSLDQAIAAKKFMQFDEKLFCKSLTVGNVETAFKESEHIVVGEIQTSRQEHFYEETMNFLIVPVGEDKEYKVYAPVGSILFTQHELAAVLEVPFNRVHVHTKRVGGSYGGKGFRPFALFKGATLAAKLTGKPVRMHLTRDEDIRIMGQRGEFKSIYKIGVTDNKIAGAQVQMFKNAGWNSDCSPSIVMTALIHMDAAYHFPAFDVRGETCVTNTASNTAFRAYGAPPAHITVENMIYDVCAELNLDPIAFRRANFQKAGQITHFGQELTDDDVTMEACMDRVVEKTNYYERRKQVEEFNKENKWKKRGLYIVPNKYGIGMAQMFTFQGALVNIYLDGSILISHGGIEMGQGLHTKMVQVVSHELGVPMDKIRISESANDKVPNPMMTGGSTGADLSGNALRNACQQLNERLKPIKEGNPGAPWEMIVGKACYLDVDILLLVLLVIIIIIQAWHLEAR